MSALDKLISQRSKAGASSGRKRFKLARQRAVAKMRKFALADPSFFVLELIQSAIAHGASMLHVGSDGEEFSRGGGKFSMVYGGAHYRREELGQLFDFLFTAKGALENAHLRDLAIGINALLSFSPDRIEVLTGDGTLKGSTLMSVEDGGTTVELGRPDEPVRGVHLMARGLRHPSVQGTGLSLRRAAKAATIGSVVQDRCMLTPVPVVLNGEPLSGYSSERSLPLFGYTRRTELDEGDLYGTIGLTGSYALRGIRIMVRGVWIETIPHPSDLHGKKGTWEDKKSGYIGGAVSFDRLRKTADHAGIVRDERYRELLARLDPYVAQARGRKGATAVARYSTLQGTLTLRETRDLVLASDRVVCLVDKKSVSVTAAIAALEDAAKRPLLATNAKDVEHLTSLSGGQVDIVEVRDREERAVATLLERDPSPLPAKPWLVEPVEVSPVVFAEFAAAMPQHGARVRQAASGRSESPVRIRLFTSVSPGEPDFVLPVEIRVADRTIATHRVAAAHPGHQLVVDLPGFLPQRLWAESRRNTPDPVVGAIAERAAELAQSALDAAAQAAIRTLVAGTIEPKSTPAYKALSIAATSGVLRWEFDSEGVAFWVSLPEKWAGLIEAKLLRNVAGDAVSLLTLGQIMSNNRGQIRWIEDDGRSCGGPDVLRLNSVELHSLVSLLGANVLERVLSGTTPEPQDAYRDFEAGETSPHARYQSVCAAQFHLFDRHRAGNPSDAGFVESEAGAWLSLQEILDVSVGRLELGRRADRVLRLEAADERSAVFTPAKQTHVLRCTPFEMALLGELGLRPDTGSASASEVYDADLLCASRFDEPGLVGAIGIASEADMPKVVLLDSSEGSSRVGSPARKFGVCGTLRVVSVDGINGRVVEACRHVLERAIVEVSSGRDVTGRLTETLLAFALLHTSIDDDAGHATPAVTDPIALRILRLPLFPSPTGLPGTALDLIARLRIGAPAPTDERWSPDRIVFAESLQRRRDEQVQAASATPVPALAIPESGPLSHLRVATEVTDAIRRYRPDTDGVPIRLRGVTPEIFFVFMGSRMIPLFDIEQGHEFTVPLAPKPGLPWSAEHIVTLSLLVYARANDLLEEVTNAHERTFQRRITAALLEGTLG